jgi:hypothetical protein
VFYPSNPVMKSKAFAHVIGLASGSFSHCTREDCGGDDTIGGSRWSIAPETESSDRIERK